MSLVDPARSFAALWNRCLADTDQAALARLDVLSPNTRRLHQLPLGRVSAQGALALQAKACHDARRSRYPRASTTVVDECRDTRSLPETRRVAPPFACSPRVVPAGRDDVRLRPGAADRTRHSLRGRNRRPWRRRDVVAGTRASECRAARGHGRAAD